ncbi:OprO/OprP family phosphate-selective porin [bacterium]|nr:OprO/OprP family phosphate-selective porin [bacterium]
MIQSFKAFLLASLMIYSSMAIGGEPTTDSESPAGRSVDSTAAGSTGEMAARIQAMEAELASLKQQLGTGSSNPSIMNEAGPTPSAEKVEMMADEGFPISHKLQAATAAGEDICQPKPTGAQMPAKARKLPLKARFGQGFEFYTEDEEFTMQIRNLTQVDGRFYGEQDRAEVKDSLLLPREWLIVQGKLTKPIDYFFSTAFGFNNVNVLDAYLNFHLVDDRLQIRAGRYKTPFTYEFYALPIGSLINPERSLFFNNFGLNRDVGVMAHGTIFEKHFDYAIGIFNGNRNGFLDTNDSKDLAAYWNLKPFISANDSLFQNLNVGASVNYGDQNSVAIPQTFRTVVPLIGLNTLGVPFLSLGNDVRDIGQRELWSTHLAWYHHQFSFISEWQTGFSNYARSATPWQRTEVPVDSFYIQGGYFLTGEKVTARGVLEPIRPFDVRKGKRGPGAWEPFFRYNWLNVGRQLFDQNFTDGRPWTNEVQTFGGGLNWYLNPYVKMVFEYEHAVFGDPVFVATGATQNSSNLFLVRTQISF